MRNIIVELRYLEASEHTRMTDVIDCINDFLSFLADGLDMDILSVTHLHQTDARNRTIYISTSVFCLNGQTTETIATHLGKKNGWHYAFVDGRKVTVNVSQFGVYGI